MNLISCNFSCKYQREGYCCLTDTENAKHSGDERCIYYEELVEPTNSFLSSSADSEPL